MLHKKDTSIATLALLLALAVVPKPAAASQKNQPILAQSPTTSTSIPLPKSVKSGTRVRIDGSSSAATFNQALKQRFEKEYSGTKVDIGYRGTSAALNSLLKGNIDIAAIGRPLTDKEKSQGLVAVALPRTKIAVVVGSKNTFKGSITDAQFAKMFRGEIRDWSTLGGKRGRIRLIDRPRNSDTRQALQNYPVFRNRAFRSGSNAVRLSQDTTSALINQLGTRGVGYAISNQVTNRPNARIVLMHKVSTNDPRYPFSQPVYYVYRRNNPTPAALAFLGFASAPGGQQIVKAAAGVPVASAVSKKIAQTPTASSTASKKIAQTPATPNSTPAPAAETEEANNSRELGWLWWLIPLLALLGIPIWWLLRNRCTSTSTTASPTPPPLLAGDATSETPTPTIVPPATNITETIVISPGPSPGTATTSEPLLWGEESLPTTETQSQISPTQPQETAPTPEPVWGEGSLPTTETQSQAVISPPATPNLLGGAAVIGGAGLGAAAPRSWDSSITLRVENTQQALATWQVSEAHKQAVREQGGINLAIRLYDFTDINLIQIEGWQIFQQFDVHEQVLEMLLPILVGDRNYSAEIGYLTEDARWLPLAKSNTIYIPPFQPPATEIIPPPAPALIPSTPADWDSSITLRTENSQQALATWEVSEAHKQAVRQQGGSQLAIRLYDITDINEIQTEGWQIFQQFNVHEQALEMLLPILVGDRDYTAEIGYLTEDDTPNSTLRERWLPLAKSNPINIPASIPPITEVIPPPAPALIPTTPADWGSSITLTPQSSQLALSAWQVSNRHKQALRQQGGAQLVLRLYDVTETRIDAQIPANFGQFAVDEQATQMLVAIPETNRDYVAEIGYLTDDNRWLLLARTAPARIVPSIPTVAQIAANIPTQVVTPTPTTSSISLTEFGSHQALAAWQVSDDHKQALRQQGGRQLALRLYDVTDITQTATENWEIFQQFNVNEQINQMLVPIIVSDRDYAAEIGYLTDDERWLLLARTAPIRITADTPPSTEIDLAPGVAAAIGSTPIPSSISLAPETANQILATWQISSNHKQALQEQGGRQLVLRLYDVTGIDLTQQEPQIFQQFTVDEQATQKLLEIPVSEGDYTAEIGYLTDDNRWLLLARSAPIQIVSSVSPVTEIITEIVEVPPALNTTPIDWESTITLAPENYRQALANWQVSSDHKQALQQQGGRQLAVRLYDVTEINLSQDSPQIFQQFPVGEQVDQILLPIPLLDRDYVAEIGYLTNDDNWLMAARSAPLRIVPDVLPATENVLAASSTLVTEVTDIPLIIDDSEPAQFQVEAAKFNLGLEELTPATLAAVDEGLPDLPSGYDESRIVLMPRDPQWAYTYWDIPSRHREELRQQGGSKLALRFYDVTDVDMNYQNPHSVQEFESDEMAREWYLPVPVSDRDYIVEIGYLTNDGRWLMLARSNSIRVPPLYPSSWSNDQFITIRWEEELENKQFLDLGSPIQQATAIPSNGFHNSFFSMVPTATLAPQSVSSYIFPSGVGKWASGVGFSASAAPERSRQFWLMADAELVVYGATEPDAVITIGGRPIKANSDGTFRFQLSFQDGLLDYPIEAVATDGEQTRSIHLKFNRETPVRNTNPKEEAQE